MADFMNFLDPNALYQTATSQGFSYWISMGVQIITSTIIGGLVLVVLAYLFSQKFNESISPANAFLVALIGNVINFFGIMGILLSFMAVVPFAGIILPIAVWIVLMKVFFSQMSIIHVVILALVFFGVTMFVTPYLTQMVMGFIPSFG